MFVAVVVLNYLMRIGFHGFISILDCLHNLTKPFKDERRLLNCCLI